LECGVAIVRILSFLVLHQTSVAFGIAQKEAETSLVLTVEREIRLNCPAGPPRKKIPIPFPAVITKPAPHTTLPRKGLTEVLTPQKDSSTSQARAAAFSHIFTIPSGHLDTAAFYLFVCNPTLKVGIGEHDYNSTYADDGRSGNLAH